MSWIKESSKKNKKIWMNSYETCNMLIFSYLTHNVFIYSILASIGEALEFMLQHASGKATLKREL